MARALDASRAAIVARIEALERYAWSVGEAERAYQARLHVEELQGNWHQYQELVAEAGVGRLAVPEIDELAGEAWRLEQALDTARRALERLGG